MAENVSAKCEIRTKSYECKYLENLKRFIQNRLKEIEYQILVLKIFLKQKMLMLSMKSAPEVINENVSKL